VNDWLLWILEILQRINEMKFMSWRDTKRFEGWVSCCGREVELAGG